MLGNRSETSEAITQNQTNPFEMSLTAYVRSRNNAFGRPVGSPSLQQLEHIIGTDHDVPGLDVQIHNNPLRAIFEETVGQQSESPSSGQTASQSAEPAGNNIAEQPNTEQREREPEPTASVQDNSSNTAESTNASVSNAEVVIGKSISYSYSFLFHFSNS